MAQDLGWLRFNEGDVAFAKAIGVALSGPDERTARSPYEDEDDGPLFMNSVRLRSVEF